MESFRKRVKSYERTLSVLINRFVAFAKKPFFFVFFSFFKTLSDQTGRELILRGWSCHGWDRHSGCWTCNRHLLALSSVQVNIKCNAVQCQGLKQRTPAISIGEDEVQKGRINDQDASPLTAIPLGTQSIMHWCTPVMMMRSGTYNFPELLISSTGKAGEFQGDLFGLYELQADIYQNRSVYKQKHTTGAESLQYLYT